MEKNKEKSFYDIHCPNCGAPARFDIVKQRYLCAYCGSEVGISEAYEQKQEFKKIHQEKLQANIASYKLFRATCEGCGASIVFEENEALSNCAFCGRSMVRDRYLHASALPVCIIPFAVTRTEAEGLLRNWINTSRSKKEARLLSDKVSSMNGFYLPYELIRGPVYLGTERMDRGSRYHCAGFVNNEFVNCSKQLDNLLLDGMEPYDLEGLKEFDLAYVAGQRIKTPDIAGAELENRAKKETEEIYKPSLRKIMETKAVDVTADLGSAVKLPVLLPVYYICDGELMAAVNGQTGKVSVRSLKDRHYYFLPWWFKAILATLIFSAVAFAAFRLFGVAKDAALFLTAILAAFFIIVTLCLYSDTTRNSFRVMAGKEIFNSGAKTFKRRYGELEMSEEILERKTVPPVFLKKIDDREEIVKLRFTTPLRILRMVLLCVVALFLPVIIALFLNGFDFRRLELGGSAVWFCIMVPVVPIYLLKFGIVELYERPWIYRLDNKGRWKRYKEKIKLHIDKGMLKDILRIVFIPPASLAFWFALLSFCVMCYLTAFGF